MISTISLRVNLQFIITELVGEFEFNVITIHLKGKVRIFAKITLKIYYSNGITQHFFPLQALLKITMKVFELIHNPSEMTKTEGYKRSKSVILGSFESL